MGKLACLGGPPVTSDWFGKGQLIHCRDLERDYLLAAYESQIWDDWPDSDSQANKFEKEWAAFNRSQFCSLLTNGTHTLQLALETLDIGFGDEVIVPGITWQATASVVVDINAVPVIVDVEPDTLCIDPKLVQAAITPRTRAIIPVHIYHRMANLEQLQTIARKHNLYLIEDCAHTHGSRWLDKGAGTIGDFGSYSFQSSKLLNCGEGGALLMQDESRYWKVISQRSCGREFKSGLKVHSGNYRITSFQASILRGKLAALQQNASLIDRTGLALDQAVTKAPGVAPLRRIPQITRQCSYGFVFLYQKEVFDEIPAAKFRHALSAELSFSFDQVYTPLSHSEVYFPHTKKRHALSKEYLSAINPRRWQLPVADDLWFHRAVKAQWPIFNCPPERAPLLTDAITKIYEQRDELAKIQLETQMTPEQQNPWN